MNLLFACTVGENRSKQAAELFGGKHCAIEGLTYASLRWADRVYVFEKAHEDYVLKKFPSYAHKVTNLNVDDVYDYGTGKLKKVLKERWKNELVR